MNAITLPRSVVEQALEALEASGVGYEIDVLVFWEKRHTAVSALRAALEQPQDHTEQNLNMVPAGWKLVPVDPTTKMIDAARSQSSFPAGVWRAMLAAAPQPPVVEQPQVEQETVGEAGSMPGTDGFTMACFRASDVPVGTKLYTHPQPKRQPLTDGEILMVLDAADIPDLPRDFRDVDIDIARAIERAVWEKSNG